MDDQSRGEERGEPAPAGGSGPAGAGAGTDPPAADVPADPPAADVLANPSAADVPSDPPATDVPADPSAAQASVKATIARDVRLGLKSGVHTFWMLGRVMIPAYGMALVLERIGVIDALAKAAAPIMSLLGLPGEAAVPLIVGYVLNVYAAVGALQALSLDPRQITVLAIAVLIGHNLLVEGAVLQKAGMNGVAFGVLRAVAGLAAAAVANLLIGAFS